MPTLRAIRTAQRLTQGRLAYRARLSQSTVAAVEAGHRPGRHTIYHLAAVLGVDPETIDEFRAVLAPAPSEAPGCV